MQIIDAHHHFWKYSAAEYGWIDDSMAALRRDFLPRDLRMTLGRAGVDAAVSVQARQSIEETEWLLELAGHDAQIAGVVGWAPLMDPDVSRTLDRLAAWPKLKAIRHIVQSEPDDRFLLRSDFNRGITELTARHLVYDILIYARHLPVAIEFVDRHPRQRFVLDHIAKPSIRTGAIEPWRTELRELAKRQNVYCKLSGVATEADFTNPRRDHRELQPYIDATLDAFGPRRVMFGSDWPVCLAAVTYARWLKIVEDSIAPLSETEREWVMGRTAREAYSL